MTKNEDEKKIEDKTNGIRVKSIKINEMTFYLLTVFEIIYTEQAKTQVFKYHISDNELFQYQTKRAYYTKIFKDLIDNGVNSLDNLKRVVDDFETQETHKKSTHNKTIELPEDVFEEVNEYIKKENIIGQTLMLRAFERTIIRNNLDVDYLHSLVKKVEKYHKTS